MSVDNYFLQDSDFPFKAGNNGDRVRYPAYLDGEVTLLVDGLSYLEDLLLVFNSLQSGDEVFLTGWRITPELVLPNNQSVIDLFKELVNRGIIIRGILWTLKGNKVLRFDDSDQFEEIEPYDPSEIIKVASAIINSFVSDESKFHMSENWNFAKEINLHVYSSSDISKDSAIILDDRLYSIQSSHHQKSIIVKHNNKIIAYLGGIDIAKDRIDNQNHNNLHLEPETNFEKFISWHDIQAKVEGPAVKHILQNFIERWNDFRIPNIHNFYPGLPLLTDPVEPTIPDFQGRHRPINSSLYDADIHEIYNPSFFVQTLRTLPCKNYRGSSDESPYPFAQKGEQTIRKSLSKAISQARYFIYIEDQYVWPNDLINELIEKCKSGVICIIVLPQSQGVALKGRLLRNDTLEKFKDNGNGNFYIYTMERPTDNKEIFIHSKFWMINDIFMQVGSANLNFRSHTNDSELSISVYPKNTVPATMFANDNLEVEISQKIREFRKSIWSEILNLPPSNLENPINNNQPNGWPNANNQIVNFAKRYTWFHIDSDNEQESITAKIVNPRICSP